MNKAKSLRARIGTMVLLGLTSIALMGMQCGDSKEQDKLLQSLPTIPVTPGPGFVETAVTSETAVVEP